MEIKDKKFIDGVVEENIHHSDAEKSALGKKERLVFTTFSETCKEKSDKEQEIYDKDPVSFKIVPAVSELVEGVVVKMFAKSTSFANDPNVAWESSNWDVAFFTNGNALHANKPGETTITATDVENQISKSIEISVVARNASKEEQEEEPVSDDNPSTEDPNTGDDTPAGGEDPTEPTVDDPTEPTVDDPTEPTVDDPTEEPTDTPTESGD